MGYNNKKNTFEIYLEKRTKDYLNFFKIKPYKLSNYIKSVLLMKNGIPMYLTSGFDLTNAYDYLVDGNHNSGTIFQAKK